MKFCGTTLDYNGNIVDVYECEKCGLRSKFKNRFNSEGECLNCRRLIDEYHMEEAAAGII